MKPTPDRWPWNFSLLPSLTVAVLSFCQWIFSISILLDSFEDDGSYFAVYFFLCLFESRPFDNSNLHPFTSRGLFFVYLYTTNGYKRLLTDTLSAPAILLSVCNVGCFLPFSILLRLLLSMPDSRASSD